MRKTLFTAALLLGALTSANASPNTEAAKTNYAETQWEYYAADEYAGGTGTEDDPYLIETPEQLMKLAVEIENLAFDDNNWEGDYSKGKYWKQTADIVLNENVFSHVEFVYGDPWTETSINATGLRTFNGIGYVLNEVEYQVFSGTYDGGGHSISGMYCNNSNNKSMGIFNNVWGGTVKNLVVKDSYLAANANNALIAGSIEQGAVILNCQTSGIVADGGSYHAGIVGNMKGSTVKNCVTNVWAWAKNNVGGIAGKVYQSSAIDNCFFYGWIGAVRGRVLGGIMKWWGAVAPEIGLDEETIDIPNPDAPETSTTTCENPSKAANCYWADTCTVRNNRAGKMVSHSVENSTYGVVENCNAVALADMAATVTALNKQAESIEGACGWEIGADGMPALTFKEVTTGITSVTTDKAEGVYDVYGIDGTVVRRGISKADALNGLTKGVYIMNGKKYVVK